MDWLWLMSKVILQTVGIIKNKIKIHSTWNQTNVQNITFDLDNMMTSSNGNMFRATGPLCGELTGDRWIPLTKGSDV